MIRPNRSLVLFAFVLVPSLRASVLVVAPSGAPYSAIQPAVDAAVDGDTILVKPGNYAGFSLISKGLTIAADPEGSVFLSSSSVVDNLGPTQRAQISGFTFPAAANGGFHAENDSGSVRFEALHAQPPTGVTTNASALYLAGCLDVAVLRCTLPGGASSIIFPSYPGSGLEVRNSRVAVYDSQISGGQGSNGQYIGAGGSSYPPLAGAMGCNVVGASTVFLSGSTIVGGQGGGGLDAICGVIGAGPGVPGGIGLAFGPTALVMLLDTAPQGGQGGNGGYGAQCGAMDAPQGTNGAASSPGAILFAPLSRHVSAPALVRELAPLAVTVTGQPGDFVWLQIGGTPTWALDLPFSGVRLVSTANRSTRYFLGALPGSGTLTTTLAFPDMGPGVEARTNHMQALFRDVAGQNVWGTGEVFTLLDSAF